MAYAFQCDKLFISTKMSITIYKDDINGYKYKTLVAMKFSFLPLEALFPFNF